jgi:CheY-like chemotaxis protein/anti-sigma regulatory factor (Ser/Thr protein kinase)
VQLSRQLVRDACLVHADSHRLQQAVLNLLSNAIKFTPADGRVGLTLHCDRTHAILRVVDTGIGIPPEFLSHVFERFRQADGSTTRTHGGLGLGLAIVRHLVELHGGTVEAASEGEGRGAVFTVKLPVAIVRPGDEEGHPTHGMHVAAAGTVKGLGPSLRGLRVLVVDDDRDGLELVSMILVSGGAEVKAFSSAAEGLEALQAWRPDVLISDIEMPGEDGYAFIRRVRALDGAASARLPAVALTAYGRVEDRLRTLAAGYSMHIPKPVDPAELTTVVASLAGRT